MEFNRKEIENIILESSLKLKELEPSYKSFSILENFPLNVNQCLYLVNWKDSSVPFQRRVDKILGYSPSEFDLLTILNIAHPNDKGLVLRVSKGVIQHALEYSNFSRENSSHHISYRFRKKDGSYIKLLRQSTIYEFAKNGTMLSNLSLLTDISSTDKTTNVDWDVVTPELDLEAFKQNIYKEFINFFTKREIEIIRLIKEGITSPSIAKKLFISEGTVSSHRKNILRKSNCHNVKELIAFCKKNGITK
nr:LuxR C-terminal-related transcriptional regulator [uncultured Psychroserpens sp.]